MLMSHDIRMVSNKNNTPSSMASRNLQHLQNKVRISALKVLINQGSFNKGFKVIL